MNGYNKVILMGTVGADAEVKTLDGGNTVASMSIAVNDSYTDKTTGERKQTTEWVRIEAWKGLATFLGNWGKKGQAFLIEGRLKTDSWEQDGITKYSTKVVAERVNFAGSSKGSGDNAAQPANNAAQPANNAAQPANNAAQPANNAAQPAQGNAPAVDNNTFVAEGDDDLPF